MEGFSGQAVERIDYIAIPSSFPRPCFLSLRAKSRSPSPFTFLPACPVGTTSLYGVTVHGSYTVDILCKRGWGGVDAALMLTHLDHVTVVVRDVEKAKAFFGLLGFEEDKNVTICLLHYKSHVVFACDHFVRCIGVGCGPFGWRS